MIGSTTSWPGILFVQWSVQKWFLAWLKVKLCCKISSLPFDSNFGVKFNTKSQETDI